jgi:hypothetical protein
LYAFRTDSVPVPVKKLSHPISKRSLRALSGVILPDGTLINPVKGDVATIKKTLRDLIRSKNELIRRRKKKLVGAETGVDRPIAITQSAAPVAATAFEPDARARALLRGVELATADLAAAGGAFTLDQVRDLWRGISRQRIERRVQEKSLLAVPGPSNRRRYPTIQFNPDGTVVKGLKEVQEALDFANPWSVLNFLVNKDERLGDRRPIDLLRRGEIGLVVESARRVGEQGG